MSADFAALSGSTGYTALLAQISDRDRDLAQGLDPAVVTPTNLPTNSIRWNSANKRHEKWNGSSWVELIVAASDAYAITVTGLKAGTLYGASALAASATLTGGAGSSIDVPELKRNGSVVWSQATLTNLNQLTNGPGYITSSALSPYAPLASPALTGTPTAPTAAVDTSTTQLATTAYVVNQGYLKSATAASTYAPLTGSGASGTWGISITGTASRSNKSDALHQWDNGAPTTPEHPLASSTRTTNNAPNTFSYGTTFEFKDQAFSSGFGGNWVGLMTVAPWTGTTSGGGDPNYQLAFSPVSPNSTSPPVLRARSGLDTTWGAWATLLHSSNWSTYVTSVSGYAPAESATGSTLAARNSAGYLFATYFNQSSSNSENPTISQVMVTNGSDGYFRKASIDSFNLQLAGASNAMNRVGFKGMPDVAVFGTDFSHGVEGGMAVLTAGKTIPNSVFARGDSFGIYNDSASAITITQGTGVTLRQGGTTNTGNRTLAARGMCTVWFNSASEAIIQGSGLT